MHEAADLQHASSANPPARVHHALTTCLVLDVLHGDGLHSGSTAVRQRFDSGSTAAAKAGADAPGGGISLCFCRRGCAAPVQKPPRSTPCRSEKNRRNERTAAAKTHPAAKRTAATKSSTATKKPAATKNPSRRCVHHPRHQDGLKYLKESDYSALGIIRISTKLPESRICLAIAATFSLVRALMAASRSVSASMP